MEERAEKAADQRFCLNRMAGGADAPLMLMLTGLVPRSRSHGLVSAPLSYEEYEQARDGVVETIAQARPSGVTTQAAELAGMDLTIYAVQRDEPGPFMWSKRDGLAEAAARGELGLKDFAAFLEAMDETVIWPED